VARSESTEDPRAGVTERVRRARLRARRGPLRGGDRLGKYRIVRRIGDGGFAWVYEAIDKIEGSHVALKVPRVELVSRANLDTFLPEVRTQATLDHPNILPVKNADLIGELFVIAVPLAKCSLVERLH
jgi:serine/threonine-protein kinase